MTDLRPYSLYQDIEDRVHPLKDEFYYEWWYNDFRFENGWSAVANWHFSDWLKKPRVPSVEISIYDPDGNRYFEETVVKPGEVFASEEKCDVEIGGHRFWQEGDNYRLIVNSKNVGADLTLRRLVPPLFIAPEGNIYSDPSSPDRHYWVVSIPRGEAFGKLIVDGKEMMVKGSCYHDHNWGTCDMNQNFGGWTWGRFFDEEYSGIFSLSYPLSSIPLYQKPGTDHAGIIYLAKHDELILLSEGIELITLVDGFDEPTGQTTPLKFILKAKEDNCEFSAVMDVQKIVERDHLKFAGWKTHNWRFLDNYEATITLNGKTDIVKGQTLHERFLLRMK